MKEQAIQKAIIDYLRWQKFLCFKINTVGIRKPDNSYIPVGRKGIADIIALKEGLFIAIEVKKPGQKPTKEQEDFLAEVNQKGGIGFVARSIDDVFLELSKIKSELIITKE